MDTTSTPTPAASVAFTASEALQIATTIGSLVSALVPGAAAVATVAEGAATLLVDTVLPAIQHLQPQYISVVQQATIAAQAAALRLKVGAPAATTN